MRLLEGERNSDGVRQILLYLRSRSFGFPYIKEFGDAAAHFDNRNQGLIFQKIKDFALNTEFKIRLNLEPFKFTHPPDDVLMSLALPAAIRNLGDEIFEKNFEIKKGEAENIINDLVKSTCIRIRNGQIHVFKLLNEKQSKVLRLATQCISVGSPFICDDVIDQILKCLVKNRIVSAAELRNPQKLREFISLFFIEMLDSASIEYMKRSDLTLFAGYEYIKDVPTLIVNGSFDLPGRESQQAMCFKVFETSLDARKYCDDSLPLALAGSRGGSWALPVELGPNGLLRSS